MTVHQKKVVNRALERDNRSPMAADVVVSRAGIVKHQRKNRIYSTASQVCALRTTDEL